MSEEKGMVSQETVTATSADAGSITPLAADLSKTQDVTTVTEVSTINSTDQFYMNQAGKFVQVDYNQLATAILNLITSKTFTLDQGTKTLIDAIDELNSKIFSVSRTVTDETELDNMTETNIAYVNGVMLNGKSVYGFAITTALGSVVSQIIIGSFSGESNLAVRGKSGSPISWKSWNFLG